MIEKIVLGNYCLAIGIAFFWGVRYAASEKRDNESKVLGILSFAVAFALIAHASMYFANRVLVGS